MNGKGKTMKPIRLLILISLIALTVCGCKKQEPPTKEDKEVAMGNSLQWLGHASFKIIHGDNIIYIDPWKLTEAPHDATLVLVSHSHSDHHSPEDVARVSGPDTKLIASAEVINKEGNGRPIRPGEKIDLNGVSITGFPAYNPNKQYHPKANNWLGFIIQIGSLRIYYAGDTDLTDEMKALKDIDIALLPVGGKYTMNAEEAAQAVKHIKGHAVNEPKRAIPYHWGDIVGKRSDADHFADIALCEVTILKPGQTINLND
jgi:L-ascorbate metabolism protein UlaG (beta-lactamase superfamily)